MLGKTSATWAPLGEVVFGVLVWAFLVGGALSLHWIATHIDPALLAILILAVAYGLYRLRKKYPIAYGTAELFIGVFVVILAAAPELVKAEAEVWALLFKFAAGIYIVVRGLDNWARSPFVTNNEWKWITRIF
jgi:hypothetical protein